MASTVIFPRKEVGDYFNENFVNLKMDMEKGEGPELQKRWDVRFYPTFLFFDAEGREVNRIVGVPEADRFLAVVQKGLEGGGLPAMAARYEAGERDTTFLTDYLEALALSSADRKKMEMVADTLLKGKGEELLTNSRLYQAFLKYNASPYSEAFRYVLSHKGEFGARYDERELDITLREVWLSYSATFIRKGADGKVVFDKDGRAAYAEEMKKWNVEDRDQILLQSDIDVAEALEDWDSYADCCSRFMKEYGANDFMIYGWVSTIQKHCKENARVRAEAVRWMKERLAALEEEKLHPAPLKEGVIPAVSMIDFPAFYQKMIAEFEN